VLTKKEVNNRLMIGNMKETMYIVM